MLHKPNVREQEHCNNVFRNVTKSVRLGVTWLIILTAGIRNFNLRSQVKRTGKIGLNKSLIYIHPFLHSHPNFSLLRPFPLSPKAQSQQFKTAKHSTGYSFNSCCKTGNALTIPECWYTLHNDHCVLKRSSLRHTTAAVPDSISEDPLW
jgi:hypothetical protein